MFRFTIQAGLLLAIIFAAAGGVYGGYAATQVSPPKGFLLFAVVSGTMSGAIGFPLGAVLAALGYAAFHWLRAHPMRYKLRTLLIVLALGPLVIAVGGAAVPTSCGADGVDSQHVKEIVALIERMPLWVFTPAVPDDSTPEAQLAAALGRAERASRIEEAMEAVAKYRLDEIRAAVQEVADSRMDAKEERLFVLNNFLFDIPEQVTSKSPVWKYVLSRYLPFPATEDSTHWPWVARKNGTYRHATKAVGFSRMGSPYPAVEAFDAYQKHFGLRPALIRQ